MTFKADVNKLLDPTLPTGKPGEAVERPGILSRVIVERPTASDASGNEKREKKRETEIITIPVPAGSSVVEVEVIRFLEMVDNAGNVEKWYFEG